MAGMGPCHVYERAHARHVRTAAHSMRPYGPSSPLRVLCGSFLSLSSPSASLPSASSAFSETYCPVGACCVVGAAM